MLYVLLFITHSGVTSFAMESQASCRAAAEQVVVFNGDYARCVNTKTGEVEEFKKIISIFGGN